MCHLQIKTFPFKFSCFSKPMNFVVAIWTKYHKIFSKIIIMVFVYMMSLKNIENFIISANRTFFKFIAFKHIRRANFWYMIFPSIQGCTFARTKKGFFTKGRNKYFFTIFTGNCSSFFRTFAMTFSGTSKLF